MKIEEMEDGYGVRVPRMGSLKGKAEIEMGAGIVGSIFGHRRYHPPRLRFRISGIRAEWRSLMVKVIAFNCSPHMDKGNTALILNPFVSGMKRAGADVELLYIRRLKIEPCIGDFQCWSETPGVCRFHDDVPELLKKMGRADIWVFGVPVYAKLPGELQNLFNRTMPLFEPTVVLRGGSLLPSRRKEVRLKKIALVSSCSYWGLENFNLVVGMLEFMARAMDVKLARPLLRPNAGFLKAMVEKGDDRFHIIEAAEEAGTQLADRGDIRKKTAEAVQIPFMTRKRFLAENG